MKRLLAGAAILCWSVCGAGPAAAQGAAPRVFDGAPAAPWIFSPSAGGNDFGVFHFRRVFELSAKPATFVVHVSADNRYRLFVNGERGVLRAAAFRPDALALRDGGCGSPSSSRPQRHRCARVELGA